METRVGFGYDLHRLVRERKLIIAGIEVEHDRGALAHSDGDAAIHALIDAILTAMGEADIGQHFPDTDNKYKDIDSSILLYEVMQICRNKGYIVNNVSLTIVLEKPKLAEYIPVMKIKLANILGVGSDRVGIAAKTNEKIGATGREEAIVAYAIALLIKK